MLKYEGFVSRIIFRNEENRYTVFELTLSATEPEGAEGSAGPAEEALPGAPERADRSGKTVPRRGSAGPAEEAQPGAPEREDRSGKTVSRRGSAGSKAAALPEGQAWAEKEEGAGILTCVGFPVSISEGESCVVSGEHQTHPVYGEQFRAQSYRAVPPRGAEAIYRYLAAGTVRGIRKALAARIVRTFGDDTIRIMEEEPEKLVRIKGISPRIAREIGAQMEEKKDLRDAMLFLQQYGIGSAQAARIWDTYGMEIYGILRDNPYRLAEDIRGIGFATADEIARRIGIRADSEYRIRSGILYVLFQASGEGHSFLPEDQLMKRTCALLHLSAEEVSIQLENLAVERRVRIRRSPAAFPGDLPPAAGSAGTMDFPEELSAPLQAERVLSSSPRAEKDLSVSLQTEKVLSAGFAMPSVPESADPAGVFGELTPPPQAEVYLAGVYRREQEIARMLLDLDEQVQELDGAGFSEPLQEPGSGERELIGSRTAERSASKLEKGGESSPASAEKSAGSRKSLRERRLRSLEKKIAALEKEEGICLDDLQRQAVLEAARRAVLILTGGPGTGKTTTINTLIRFFEEEDMEVLLAAPTGRAARRMSEAAGRPAMTIHRLLGVRSIDEEGGTVSISDASAGGAAGERGSGSRPEPRSYAEFEKNEANPLEADAVIIDEMSMVDMNLFHALLKAVPPGARLILVGDVNQLPSVGPGCVLQDLIASGRFHTILLRRIFRQATESDIVMNAHRILEGGALRLDNKSRDFFFLERNQAPVIYKHIVQLISQMLPGYVGCRPEEIQVLTPMRRGSLGVEQLNRVLQSALNPPSPDKREYTWQETVFREGDKVMQTRNNYRLEWEVRGNFGLPVEKGTGIFNGDFGRIERIDREARSMTVCFDDARTVEYAFSDLEDLEPAYAVTVHKSQGSEYPAVLIPLLQGPSGLFNRNLLYTAVTRARRCVVILGSRGSVDAMIANTRRTRRYTGLCDRIREMEAECG